MRFRGRKNPVSGLPICSHFSPVSEELSKLSSHRNRRPGLLGLHFLRGLSLDPRSTHVNAFVGVVNVLPLQSGNFGKPQARRRD